MCDTTRKFPRQLSGFAASSSCDVNDRHYSSRENIPHHSKPESSLCNCWAASGLCIAALLPPAPFQLPWSMTYRPLHHRFLLLLSNSVDTVWSRHWWSDMRICWLAFAESFEASQATSTGGVTVGRAKQVLMLLTAYTAA